MNEVSDPWFILLPSGRVYRAASTDVLRQQIHSGKIPRASSVRRSPDDEWTALEWTREFADLLDQFPPPRAAEQAKDKLDPGGERSAPTAGSGLSARLDRTRLPTIGVRGMVHELLAALDATLVRRKLAAAALAGLAAGLILAAPQLPMLPFESAAPWARWIAAGFLVLLIVTATAAVLTRMTFLELSKMRPARWGEGFTGMLGTTLRIIVAQLLTAGVAGGAIVLLRLLPGWLLDQHVGGAASDGLAAAATAIGMILELALWPIIGFALLLPPIFVVERCSIGRALSQWLHLLKTDLGRVFLNEALALGLGLAATLLLALPWLALVAYTADPRVATAVTLTRGVLAGLAAAPLLGYLMVANLFIYINLRYEAASGAASAR
ncbi:MAG TPA: hypothetical protein VMS17_14390, partial [Gemmataceae bacterium]|nr:hypothetical protein [Gemmataceae bacterium]